MPERLTTATELATEWGLTETELKRRARRYGWPVVRLSRTDWRFTEQQIEQIVAMQTTAARAPSREPSPTGQSKLSRARTR